jgi:hypothetical protein
MTRILRSIMPRITGICMIASWRSEPQTKAADNLTGSGPPSGYNNRRRPPRLGSNHVSPGNAPPPLVPSDLEEVDRRQALGGWTT